MKIVWPSWWLLLPTTMSFTTYAIHLPLCRTNTNSKVNTCIYFLIYMLKITKRIRRASVLSSKCEKPLLMSVKRTLALSKWKVTSHHTFVHANWVFKLGNNLKTFSLSFSDWVSSDDEIYLNDDVLQSSRNQRTCGNNKLARHVRKPCSPEWQIASGELSIQLLSHLRNWPNNPW
jgi:hypothetical protein